MNEDQVEGTGYSIAPEPPSPPDRRSGERFVRLLRVGAITIGNRRELCLIRNVSAGGMMIRAYTPLLVGAAVSIELKQGDPIAATVRWSENGVTGVLFDSPIDVVGLLSTDSSGPPPRLPRIELECGAWVRQQARLVRATVLNISQGGLCVRCPAPLDIGAAVVVTLPCLTPHPGIVKWRKDDCCGVGFNRRLGLSELVEWLKERQARAPQRLAS
jgi:hypothetical protein